jgi:hypothetical protein
MNQRKEHPALFLRKEQTIREHRTIEAMKNGYMGGEGKLARIAKTFGEPMVRQGSANFEQNFLPDFDEIPDEDAIPYFDEEEVTHLIGWHFDGLRRGIHLEISWNEETRDLKTYWQGHLVYRELANELDGYVPGHEWEKVVENLFESCKKKERTNRKAQAKVVNREARREQAEFLQEMRLKWGI